MPTQLSGFTTVKDTPSATQSYELLITGAHGKLLTIAPPTGTEVSLNQNGPFVSQLVVTVATDDEKKTVFVRLTGQQPVGSYKGTIYNWLYPDDIEQKVVVEGLIKAKPAAPVSTTSLSGLATIKGTPSAAKSFVITPTSQALGKTITITVYGPYGTPDAFEVSFAQTGPYTQSLAFTVQPNNLPRTVYVRISSSAPVGFVNTGLFVGPELADLQLVEVSGTVSDSPTGSSLQLVAPLYNCQSGAFTFQTTGGDGSPITFSAIGITGPTTNPNQFVDAETRTATDAPPILLRASQNGTEVTFLFDIRAACPVGSNKPPFFNGPLANQTVQQGSNANVPLPAGTFTDPENQPLTLSATGLPNGLSFNGNAFSGTPTQSGSFAVTIKATDPNGLSALGTFTLTVTPAGEPDPNPNPGGNLHLVAPVYNCQTGAFTFQTTGGDGSPIIFSAIGITGPTTNPNQFVDAETRTALDAKPITLRAIQNGTEVTFLFDTRAICPVGDNPAPGPGNPPTPPTDGGLQLLTPTYDCQSGAFTFRTTGGNGTAIEFSAAGITGPTTNPNQFVDTELRTAADAQPITLRAKQSGVEVTLLFDIRAACPIGTGARQSAPTALTPELGSKLTALVYPNPVQDDLTVSIEGAAGQTVRMKLVGLNGLGPVDKLIQILRPQHEEKVNMGQQAAGLYLLQIQTTQGVVSLKVIKQ